MMVPVGINQRWSLDFVSDTLADGRRFRVLCVLDDFSRECLAAVVDTSLGGMCVVRELELVVSQRGWPHTIVSDNGTELTSNAVLRWLPSGCPGTTSSPASRCRTPSLKASTANFATSVSMNIVSSGSPKRAI
jgi:transposase InsO family protein